MYGYADNSLLAQIGLIVAPEKELLRRFFLAVDQDVRKRGFHLSVYGDFREFKELSLRMGKTLFPSFDPDLHDLDPNQAFWLALREGGEGGPTIAVQAGKLYLFGERTLGDYIATGRFFYEDPLAQMESGERFILQGDAERFASQVVGRVAYSGGTTIAPEWRGRTNLAKVLPLLSHALGYSRWYIDRVMSLVYDDLHRAGVAKRYAHTTECDGFEWHRPRMGDRKRMWIVSKEAGDVLDQVRGYLSQPADERLRIGEPRSAMVGN